MLMDFCPGYCQNQLERMNARVDEDNMRDIGMVKVRIRKAWWFSSNEFWKNICCLVLDPTFGLGGLSILNKEQNISVNNSKIR